MDARMMGAKAAAAKWGCSVRTMQSLKTEEGEPADPGDREAYVTALYRKMERTSSQLQDVVGVCNRLLLKDDAKILKDLAARPDGAGAETLSKIAHNAMRGVEVTIPKQNVTKKSEGGAELAAASAGEADAGAGGFRASSELRHGATGREEGPVMRKEPLPPWIPKPNQHEFIWLDTFEAAIGGAVGGGKTDGLIRLPVERGFVRYSQYKALILRKTEQELQKEIIIRSREWWERPPYYARWNGTRLNHTFPSGAMIQYGSGTTRKDVEKFDGIEFQTILIDEAGHYEWDVIAYLTIRIRASKLKLTLEDGSPFPVYLRYSIMPGGPGQIWFPDRFMKGIKGGEHGRKLIQQRHTRPDGSTFMLDRIFIPSGIQDMKGVIDESYADRFYLLPEHERNAKLYGDWKAYHGQVFTSLRIERRPGEPERALHVRPPVEIPKWWIHFVAIDPGTAANCCMLWFAIDPETYQLHVYRGYNRKGLLVSEWGSDCARLSQREDISIVGMDGNAWNKGGLPDTVQSEFTKHSGFRPYPIQNKLKDRISGKLAVQEMLRWEAKPKSREAEEGYDESLAGMIYRVQGLQAARAYRDRFLDEPEEIGLPKLIIHAESPEGESLSFLWECIQTRVPDEKRPEDVAQTRGDDPYDALRYGIGLYGRILAGESGLQVDSKLREWWHRERLTEDELTSYNVMRQLLPKGFEPGKAGERRFGTPYARAGKAHGQRRKVDPWIRLFMEQDIQEEREFFVDERGIRDAPRRFQSRNPVRSGRFVQPRGRRRP